MSRLFLKLRKIQQLENCKIVDFNYPTPVWRQLSQKRRGISTNNLYCTSATQCLSRLANWSCNSLNTTAHYPPESPKLPLSSTTLSFDTPAQRKPAYASYFWKLDSLAYIFVADSMGLSSFNFFAVASKRRIFSAIECASAVQGHPTHPRSIILLPIESVYAVRLPISASL